MMPKSTKKCEGPRLGRCKCGHTGNREDSQHGPRFAPGHGACKVRGCGCAQFTWVEFVGEKR
jgi:hypothetical protein